MGPDPEARTPGSFQRCPAVPTPGSGTAGHLGATSTPSGERACPTVPAGSADAGQQRTAVVPPVPLSVPPPGQVGQKGGTPPAAEAPAPPHRSEGRAAADRVEALMLARGGVALADSADASRCYPDLWPSPAAARQAFHRARRVTKPHGETAGRDCHAPLRRAT
jgi:hypothetical protein